MFKFRAFFCTCVLAILAAHPLEAVADTKKDFETISKAVGFLEGGPSGDVVADVVFNPANPDSVAHADQVLSLLAGGVGSKVKLSGKKVASAAEVTSRVVFLTRGTSGTYADVLGKATALKGITVSTDPACLGAGCVMVVKTEPSVDILVSTALAGKAGAVFASAFRMLITEK